MQRAQPRVRQNLRARVADLEGRNPEWRPWLALLGELERALAEPAPDGDTDLIRPTAARPDGAPLLQGADVAVDTGRLTRWLGRLTAAVAAGDRSAPLAQYRPAPGAAVGLVGATLRQDSRAIERLAGDAALAPAALATLAHVAVVPLLLAAARSPAGSPPPHWPHGYCPICAAWPILAEMRGLDRSRRLRCGRCATEWTVPWLRCAYCGEARHERLGSLVVEGEMETRKVETCATCHGYLKAVTTLEALSPVELYVRDLETVELDLIAVERGFARPDGPGYPLDVRVTPAGP